MAPVKMMRKTTISIDRTLLMMAYGAFLTRTTIMSKDHQPTHPTTLPQIAGVFSSLTQATNEILGGNPVFLDKVCNIYTSFLTSPTTIKILGYKPTAPHPQNQPSDSLCKEILDIKATISTLCKSMQGAKFPSGKAPTVTGKGQKTSSVLSRALSRIEMRFWLRQSDCLTEVGRNCKSYLSVETEETQLGSLGDQVSSYLYYTRYAERPTTDATWNTPIVWVTTSHANYES